MTHRRHLPWALAASLLLSGVTASPVALSRDIHITTALMAFSPAEVQAEVGDRIVWNNGGDVRHEIYFPANPGGSGLPHLDFILKNGRDITLRLATPGDYPYVCRWHGMHGMIHVAPRAEQPSP